MKPKPVKSADLVAAYKRAITSTRDGKYKDGESIAGEIILRDRVYQVTVKVDSDKWNWV